MMKDSSKYQQFIGQVLNNYSQPNDKSVELLTSISSIQHIHRGELLLNFGEVSKTIHILYNGAFVSYFINREGDIYHKNIFLEGDFVGSMVSAVTEQPSEFALEAVENSTLISINFKQFRKLTDEHADLKDFYLAYLEKNWVIDKEKRELDIVLKTATERYMEYVSKNPEIEKRIPLHYIASNLGITPTQLSRIRKKLR